MRGSVAAVAADAGMTSSLVTLAIEFARRGAVWVVCSHASSRLAFQRACAEREVPGRMRVETLSGHLARLMRDDSASSGVPPNFVVGSGAAGRALVMRAAQGMLELTWPELRDGSVGVEVPYARRVDTLLDEAADLIAWLRRNRIVPDEFRTACATGLLEFYGDGVENARIRLADPDTLRRASKRAREAMRATDETLSEQRRAEGDLGILLVRLYEGYIETARHSAVITEADVIDGALSWLSGDAAAARRAFCDCAAIVVDDAEDAEPALPALLQLARSAGVADIVVAGRNASAIDHLDGRRACTALGHAAWTRPAFTRAPDVRPHGRRFADERSEADWLAETITDLVAAGASPDDIAVLGRDDDAADTYARLLADRGLPILPPSTRYADPAGIADLFALARVCDDPFDQARLLRVLASPLAGLSDASLWALCRDPAPERQLAMEMENAHAARGAMRKPGLTRLATNMLTGAADGALPDETKAIVRGLRDRLERWRRVCARTTPSNALRYLAVTAGFEASWRRSPAYRARRFADDLSRIKTALDAAWASSDGANGLSQTIAAVEDGIIPPRRAERTEGAIVCEGVVAVKGLRFPHVFVAGVARERFPRVYVPRALAFSRTFGLIVRENISVGPTQTAKFAWYYAKFEAKRRYLEGERRVLAYAASRGMMTATVTGFGTAPGWAPDEDLLARYVDGTT